MTTWEWDDWNPSTPPRDVMNRWSAMFGGVACVVDEDVSVSGAETWFSFAVHAPGGRQESGTYLKTKESAFDAAYAAAQKLIS